MLFPNNFKKQIAGVFYDKEVGVKQVTVTTSAEGQRKKTLGSVTRTFKGNVQFGNRKAVVEQYGLKNEFDLTITTDDTVDLNDVICYDNIDYVVTDVIKCDTHNLIVASKYGK